MIFYQLFIILYFSTGLLIEIDYYFVDQKQTRGFVSDVERVTNKMFILNSQKLTQEMLLKT